MDCSPGHEDERTGAGLKRSLCNLNLQLTFDNGQGILSYAKGQPTGMPKTGSAGDSTAPLAALGALAAGAALLNAELMLAEGWLD